MSNGLERKEDLYEVGVIEETEETVPDRGCDPPVEDWEYFDGGCEYFDSCLNCPFPECRYDQPGKKVHWSKRLRDGEVKHRFSRGSSIREIACTYHVSERTIYRILEEKGQYRSRQKHMKHPTGKRGVP
ncbi:MAG: hypothetical protein NTV30_11325 [Chloroflexi bacterium]|nr:hypothetical protein [Chloroflexota bacterium]